VLLLLLPVLVLVLVPMPPAPPAPVLVDVLVLVPPPAPVDVLVPPPAPPMPVLVDALELVPPPAPPMPVPVDVLVLAPPSGVYGVQGGPASVTPQIAGAMQTLLVQMPLQHWPGPVHGESVVAQLLKDFAPAMHTLFEEGSVRSTIVACSVAMSTHW